MAKDKKDPLIREEFDQTIPLDSNGETEKRSIPKICPWCNKIIKIEEWEVKHNKKTAPFHGICRKCFEKHQEELNDDEDGEKYEETLEIINQGNKEIKNIPIICISCDKIFQISQWEIENKQKAGVARAICPECQKKNEEEYLENLKKEKRDQVNDG